jgi:hypothetical protein
MRTSEIVTDKVMLSTWIKLYNLNLMSDDQLYARLNHMKTKYRNKRLSLLN